MNLELVEWEDAWHVTKRQAKISDEELLPLRTWSVGWVVKENGSGILLCATRYFEDEDQMEEYNFPDFLLHKMIVKRTVLGVRDVPTIHADTEGSSEDGAKKNLVPQRGSPQSTEASGYYCWPV
jgi:hypothetical protein